MGEFKKRLKVVDWHSVKAFCFFLGVFVERSENDPSFSFFPVEWPSAGPMPYDVASKKQRGAHAGEPKSFCALQY